MFVILLLIKIWLINQWNYARKQGKYGCHSVTKPPHTDVYPCKSSTRYAFYYVRTHWQVTNVYKATHKNIKK